MSRRANTDVTHLVTSLNITADYARKILNGSRPLTDEHREILNGTYGGYLMQLVKRYGLLAPVSMKMVKEELLGVLRADESMELDSPLTLTELAELKNSLVALIARRA